MRNFGGISPIMNHGAPPPLTSTRHLLMNIDISETQIPSFPRRASMEFHFAKKSIVISTTMAATRANTSQSIPTCFPWRDSPTRQHESSTSSKATSPASYDSFETRQASTTSTSISAYRMQRLRWALVASCHHRIHCHGPTHVKQTRWKRFVPRSCPIWAIQVDIVVVAMSK